MREGQSNFISPFQREVADAFFALPASRGFLIAGGAALIAAGVVERATDDLDLFGTRSTSNVSAAKVELLTACEGNGWQVEVARDTDEFVRLVISSGADELAVDLGIDADPLLPSTVTFLGPTIGVEENAGRKTLALFGRWMPRDFVDVQALAARYGKERLIALAAERDSGFDLDFFASALEQVTRIRTERFPISPERLPALIAFFTNWATEIRSRD